jgi:membrane-bound lytic murein transglycosylase F
MKKLILILTIVFCLMSCTNSSQGDDTINDEVTNDVISTVIEDPVIDAVTVAEEVPEKEEVVAVNLGGVASKLPVDRFSDRYDIYFSKYSKRFFGATYEWRWFKSQAVAESALNPDVVSPVGARSLMQVMPRTWDEIIKRHTFIQNEPFTPRWAVAAGISYDKTLHNQWKAKRSENDRIALTMASYNAGLGNILKGQRACTAGGENNCNTWAGIKAYAHAVNTWKDEETKGYIKRIFGYMGMEGW